MPKVELSQEEIEALPKPMVAVDYCKAQHLLKGLEPAYFSASALGWDYDIFDLGDVYLCTGNRNMPGPDVTRLARVIDNRAVNVNVNDTNLLKALRDDFTRSALALYERAQTKDDPLDGTSVVIPVSPLDPTVDACPFCGSADIEGDSVGIESGYALQPVSCNSCDARWEESYAIIARYIPLDD